MQDVTLTPAEVAALSGGYTQPAAQLRALHELGYWRARRSTFNGRVVLERAHVESVARGESAPGYAPKLRIA